jgi:hypothetical protein
VAGKSILLIHPPVAKPSEPPAGMARLAGALRTRGIACHVIDANIEGLYHLLGNVQEPSDTWSRRALRHLKAHMAALQNQSAYRVPDKYRRAVADLNRLLSLVAKNAEIRVSLANYEDKNLSPLRSADLLEAAEQPECNPFYSFFQTRILKTVASLRPTAVGLSINFLSQALCTFAIIGLLRKAHPGLTIIIGGGLVTSWVRRPGWSNPFSSWVDHLIPGPGEAPLIQLMGKANPSRWPLPDYDDLVELPYLSPGFVLPFSASDGCWWRRCAFCPETSEQNPYHPMPHTQALDQLKALTRRTRPAMIHLLDNAVTPALLNRIAADPPGAPWYGFVRIGQPLDDPVVCRRLAASGCIMLKIGLESGDQNVLDALQKGVRLGMASKVLRNLKEVGIATYVYLLFGTPSEDAASAEKTLHFVAEHHRCIGFLNLAIFNLPTGSAGMDTLNRRRFYTGDLCLYSDFDHPLGWHRSAVRQFVERRFKKHPRIRPIIRRDPPIFTSNHATFFCQE